MALTVKVGKKSEEVDDLPIDEDASVDGGDVVEEDEVTRLKIENAEQRGRLSILQKTQSDPRINHEQTKISVFQDANNMDDEAFFNKYRMQKHMATAAVLEQEQRMTKAETRQELAEARASSELSARYGTDYFKYKDQVEETLNDLSPEVRQDPKRLAKHLERTYKALAVDRPTPKPKSVSGDESRRRITSDFEKPIPESDPRKNEDLKPKDEIEEQFRPLAKAIGLTSESERVKYKSIVDSGEFVPMDLGGGVSFSDPAKGFERAEKPK